MVGDVSELAARIAEKVMGLTRKDLPDRGDKVCHYPAETQWYSPSGEWVSAGPRRWDTDVAAAMEVVQQMRELGWAFDCHITGNEWHASFGNYDKNVYPPVRFHASLPTVICLAALAAVEAEKGVSDDR